MYVDGFYAGVVDDFNGVFQGLPLTPGGHSVTLFLEGYRTIRRNIYLSPGSTFNLRETMEPLPAGEVADPPEVAPPVPAPPAGTYQTPVTPPRSPLPSPTPATSATGVGTLDLRVEPADIEVRIDGKALADRRGRAPRGAVVSGQASSRAAKDRHIRGGDRYRDQRGRDEHAGAEAENAAAGVIDETARHWHVASRSGMRVNSPIDIRRAAGHVHFRPLWISVCATIDERARALAGDERIPQAIDTLTHGVTIRRAPRDVWPWLAQMGAGSRGGWYSYDWLDNGRQSSAARIVPELSIRSSDDLPCATRHDRGVHVLAIEPERVLTLGWLAPDGTPEVTWTFVLEEVAPGVTRLLVRVRGGLATVPSAAVAADQDHRTGRPFHHAAETAAGHQAPCRGDAAARARGCRLAHACGAGVTRKSWVAGWRSTSGSSTSTTERCRRESSSTLEHLADRKVEAQAGVSELRAERVREVEPQRRQRRPNAQAQAGADRQPAEGDVGGRGKRVPGIHERCAAEQLADRKPQLAVQDEQIGPSEREACDVERRKRLLRISADGVGAASLEQQIEDADRCRAREPTDRAVPDAARRRELSERLIVPTVATGTGGSSDRSRAARRRIESSSCGTGLVWRRTGCRACRG